MAGGGEFEQAAEGAAGIVEGELQHRPLTSAPIEPRGYLADWDARAQRLTWYGDDPEPAPAALGARARARPLASARSASSPQRRRRLRAEDARPPRGGARPPPRRALGRPVKWVEIARGVHARRRARAASSATAPPTTPAAACSPCTATLTADHGAVAAGPGWGMVFVGSLALPDRLRGADGRVDYTDRRHQQVALVGARPLRQGGTALVMERILDDVAAAHGHRPARDPPAQLGRGATNSRTRPPTGLGSTAAIIMACSRRRSSCSTTTRCARSRRRSARGPCVGIGIGFELLPEGGDIPGALVGGFDPHGADGPLGRGHGAHRRHEPRRRKRRRHRADRRRPPRRR